MLGPLCPSLLFGEDSFIRVHQGPKGLKSCLFFFFFKILLIYFRGEGRETSMCGCFLCTPPTGDMAWPATQTCAPNENGTIDRLVCRLVLNPLSHTSQDRKAVSCCSVLLWLCALYFYQELFMIISSQHNCDLLAYGLFILSLL